MYHEAPLAFLARLRLRSAGELLDQSVSIAVRNVVPLGTIAVIQLLASFIARKALSLFVLAPVVQRSHVMSARDAALQVQGVRSMVDGVGATIDFACTAVGIMASAIIIEELLSRTRPDLRGAIAEAFGEWRPAIVVLVVYLALLGITAMLGVGGAAAFVAHDPSAAVLGSVLVILAAFGAVVIPTAMYVAWVHLALRASFGDDRFFLTGAYVLRPSTTTLLALLVVLVLSNAAYAVWQGALYMHIPLVLARAAYLPVLFASTLLLNAFVVFFYLDLCARHGGIDLAQEIDALRGRGRLHDSGQ